MDRVNESFICCSGAGVGRVFFQLEFFLRVDLFLLDFLDFFEVLFFLDFDFFEFLPELFLDRVCVVFAFDFDDLRA